MMKQLQSIQVPAAVMAAEIITAVEARPVVVAVPEQQMMELVAVIQFITLIC